MTDKKLRQEADRIRKEHRLAVFDNQEFIEHIIDVMIAFKDSASVEEFYKQKFKLDMIEFGNWLGFHYYRVSGWKWHSIKNDGDSTEYSIEELYDLFISSKVK